MLVSIVHAPAHKNPGPIRTVTIRSSCKKRGRGMRRERSLGRFGGDPLPDATREVAVTVWWCVVCPLVVEGAAIFHERLSPLENPWETIRTDEAYCCIMAVPIDWNSEKKKRFFAESACIGRARIGFKPQKSSPVYVTAPHRPLSQTRFPSYPPVPHCFGLLSIKFGEQRRSVRPTRVVLGLAR